MMGKLAGLITLGAGYEYMRLRDKKKKKKTMKKEQKKALEKAVAKKKAKKQGY